jgi:hypothetical protein
MAPTPRQWWNAVPDHQRPAWREAAAHGRLPADMAAALDAAGIILARHDGTAYMPPQFMEAILAP